MEEIEKLIEYDWQDVDSNTEARALMLIAFYLKRIAEVLATNSNK